MSSMTETVATLDDLLKVKEKAELIAGRIVSLMPSGALPNEAGFRNTMSLYEYAKRAKSGHAHSEGVGFTVPVLTSGRQSFCPDSAYHTGPLPANLMRFVEGPPTFAVEVRSEGDYGRSAEAHMFAKREDYFEAGTLVVWDVDPVARLVRKYGADQPNQAVVFSSGEVADAEPAVPGWRMDVNAIFGEGDA